jgi:hypothetical protein
MILVGFGYHARSHAAVALDAWGFEQCGVGAKNG